MMNSKKMAGGAAVVAIAATALLSAGAASAQDAYRPLTVNPHHTAPRGGVYAPPAYDAYHNRGTIVTGPVHFAGSIADFPFRMLNSIFPATGNNPLVLIGAPIHFAGRLVQVPFRIAEAPFGGPNPFED